MIASAIAFVLLIFFLNNRNLFNRQIQTTTGLTYNSDELLSDLVKKDTDGDGVFDWEEGLWGTDPMKKDTSGSGLGDKAEIERQKAIRDVTSEDTVGSGTSTDQFSKELLATIATMSQTGEIDQDTIERLSEELALQIATSSVPSEVFSRTNLKVKNDNSLASVQAYKTAIDKVFKDNYIEKGAIDILTDFVEGDGEAGSDTLFISDLNTLMTGVRGIIDDLLKVEVPSAFVSEHLNLLNTTRVCLQNFSDMTKIAADPIVAFSGITSYEANGALLDEATNELYQVIRNKLNN